MKQAEWWPSAEVWQAVVTIHYHWVLMRCQDTNTTKSGCQTHGYCMFLIDSTQCSPFLPLASWLLQSKWILISLFSFGIFKEPKVILAARFTCQLHLLYVWALFKSRSIKRASQRGIKELKLLSFALYQSLDGNQVQIPVFQGTINICVKKGV